MDSDVEDDNGDFDNCACNLLGVPIPILGYRYAFLRLSKILS